MEKKGRPRKATSRCLWHCKVVAVMVWGAITCGVGPLQFLDAHISAEKYTETLQIHQKLTMERKTRYSINLPSWQCASAEPKPLKGYHSGES